MCFLVEGQRIEPGYVVERLLGEGAFAEVYRVRHRFMGRQAMKVFKQAGSGALMTEAVLLTRIAHPNIVRVFDAGTVATAFGERGFFTMEYVAGGTLYRLWATPRNRPIAVAETVRIIHQVSRGLAAAHAERPPIIHLDITPHNILIGPDGRARLGDFGLAKVARPLPGKARGQVTLAFAAPESMLGAVAESCAMDVWSLGAIAYLLLTDRHPYPEGASRRTRPVAPSALNSDADTRLDDIVLAALDPNPVGRTPNATVLAGQLADWGAGL
ncbi:serine/threonine-protein kinase [Kibdelosporangium banguiense]|uniref:non-specific serine/threonine protein kinase n=1 Tax=Kibdelosporangium banguiense TaxID=1365924 RepID=A0ABS4TJ19_9PSEU|nr:serine/threonine-protein kinase [Kibdelosporangium banguiense]MBP2324409.1 serine/threonine-protein kinase [Kibdelosporangium banguiense]